MDRQAASALLANRFSQRFGLDYPFASAAMAFAGMTPELAIAVCRAGGLGAVGAGIMPPEALRGVIQAIRSATATPFNINFITCFDNDAQIRVCAEEQVPVVSFHWGHPAAVHLQLLGDAGVSVWEQVGSAETARRAAGDGVEVIIAQGQEAGGHNYQGLPTFVLVPEIVDAVDGAMVLAAGGISDGRGAAAALALGADGVWVGTRLLASPEAFVHPDYRARVLAASGADTVFSAIFGPEFPHFNPMRVQKNRLVAEWNDRLDEVPQDRSGLPVIGQSDLGGMLHEKRKFDFTLAVPSTTGDMEEMPWLMGQGVGLVRDVRPAGDIVESMMGEAAEILSRLGGRNG